MAVKESQIPGSGIYSWSAKIVHLRQLEGVSFVNRGCTKGVHFLSKMVCKRITGGGKVGRPSSYSTLLSAPPSSLRPAARSCVIFAACYCHILSVLLFIVFNWNASIFLASKSSVHSFTYFSRETSRGSVRPIKTFLHDGFFSLYAPWWGRICPISWRICKLLAVFIGLTIMGWLNLLTKCLIM